MSGSLLPNITYAAQNTPLYGTGGGGATIPANLTVSTLEAYPVAGDSLSRVSIGTQAAGGGNPLAETLNMFHVSTIDTLFLQSSSDAVGGLVADFRLYNKGNGSESGIARRNGPGNPGASSAVRFFSTIAGTNFPGVSIEDGLGANLKVTNGSTITTNLQVTNINGAAYPPASVIQSTIANAGTYIDIPAGASPVQFNLLNGASFSTPANAQLITINGIITNNATLEASFLAGISTTNITTTTVNSSAFTTNSTSALGVALLPQNGSAGSTIALSGNIPLLSGGAYRISWNYVASNTASDGGTFCLLAGLAATPPLLAIPNIELNTGTPVEGYGACIVRNTTAGTVNVTIQGYNSSTTGQTTLAGSTNWLVEYLGQVAI
jgi:hypothetical protein